MTLEQPKPTREQIVESDLGMTIARQAIDLAHLRATNRELQDVNADLEGQLEDASDRA